MRRLPRPAPAPEPSPTYPEQLAALEAWRQASDDILLRRMLRPRDPNPS